MNTGPDPKDKIFTRLDVAALKDLFQKLPEPNDARTIGGARFELYRAKPLLTPQYDNEILRLLLIDARGSFYGYGDRPPLDDYDDKAAIYLVRALYPSSASSGTVLDTEEWLSIRFVPPEGQPFGTGEFDFFLCAGKPAGRFAAKHLYGRTGKNVLLNFASCSRMCGLGPYSVKDGRLILLGGKHRFSAFCYALIHYLFLKDAASDGKNYDYLTGIIYNKFINRALVTEFNGERYGIGFVPAFETLGFTEPRSVALDRRRKDLFIYRFPTYWFNTDQAAKLISALRECGLLSDKSLERYLAIGPPIPQVLTTDDLRYLGRLLTERGRIDGSRLTGRELRFVFDCFVDDGPEFKITPMTKVCSDAERVADIGTITEP